MKFFRFGCFFFAVASACFGAPAGAQQWSVEQHDDGRVAIVFDDSDRLGLMIDCRAGRSPELSVLSMFLVGGDSFDADRVFMAFDDAPGTWREGDARDASLFLYPADHSLIIDTLAQRALLRVGFFAYFGGQIDVRIDLVRAAPALNLLSCLGP